MIPLQEKMRLRDPVQKNETKLPRNTKELLRVIQHLPSYNYPLICSGNLKYNS